MGDIHIVVEFRNRGWLRNNTSSFLKENGMGYCVVDEPKLKGLMPFVPIITSDIGYIRFHGRNKNWFNSPLSVRYNYDYSKDELKEFVEPVKKLGLRTPKLLVFFNNCHAGHATKNAITFSKMLLEGTLG